MVDAPKAFYEWLPCHNNEYLPACDSIDKIYLRRHQEGGVE